LAEYARDTLTGLIYSREAPEAGWAPVDTPAQSPVLQPSPAPAPAAPPEGTLGEWGAAVKRGTGTAISSLGAFGVGTGLVAPETAAPWIQYGSELQQQNPPSADMRAQLEEVRKQPSTWGAFKSMAYDHPATIPVVVGESLPASVPSLVVGGAAAVPALLGGPWAALSAGATGTGVGSYAVDYGASLQEAMRYYGYDPGKAEHIRGFMSNPELYEEAKKYAASRAIPVAAFDGLSALLGGMIGGKTLSAVRGATTIPGKIGRIAAGGGAGTVTQAGLGMAGEAGGQHLTGARSDVGTAPGAGQAMSDEQAIATLESRNGDPRWLDSGVAYGLMGLRPATAREMLHQLGRDDIAGLSTDELKERLKRDHALNAEIGSRYYRQQRATFGDNRALAFAAYHGGPGNVKKWIRKFGDPRTGEVSVDAWLDKVEQAGNPKTASYARRALAMTGPTAEQVAHARYPLMGPKPFEHGDIAAEGVAEIPGGLVEMGGGAFAEHRAGQRAPAPPTTGAPPAPVTGAPPTTGSVPPAAPPAASAPSGAPSAPPAAAAATPAAAGAPPTPLAPTPSAPSGAPAPTVTGDPGVDRILSRSAEHAEALLPEWEPVHASEDEGSPIVARRNTRTGEVRPAEQHLAPIETPLSSLPPTVAAPSTVVEAAKADKAEKQAAVEALTETPAPVDAPTTKEEADAVINEAFAKIWANPQPAAPVAPAAPGFFSPTHIETATQRPVRITDAGDTRTLDRGDGSVSILRFGTPKLPPLDPKQYRPVEAPTAAPPSPAPTAEALAEPGAMGTPTLSEADHRHLVALIRSGGVTPRVASIQRHVRGTHEQAKRIMRRLEAEGVVGNADRTGLRQVLGPAPAAPSPAPAGGDFAADAKPPALTAEPESASAAEPEKAIKSPLTPEPASAPAAAPEGEGTPSPTPAEEAEEGRAEKPEKKEAEQPAEAPAESTESPAEERKPAAPEEPTGPAPRPGEAPKADPARTVYFHARYEPNPDGKHVSIKLTTRDEVSGNFGRIGEPNDVLSPIREEWRKAMARAWDWYVVSQPDKTWTRDDGSEMEMRKGMLDLDRGTETRFTGEVRKGRERVFNKTAYPPTQFFFAGSKLGIGSPKINKLAQFLHLPTWPEVERVLKGEATETGLGLAQKESLKTRQPPAEPTPPPAAEPEMPAVARLREERERVAAIDATNKYLRGYFQAPDEQQFHRHLKDWDAATKGPPPHVFGTASGTPYQASAMQKNSGLAAAGRRAQALADQTGSKILFVVETDANGHAGRGYFVEGPPGFDLMDRTAPNTFTLIETWLPKSSAGVFEPGGYRPPAPAPAAAPAAKSKRPPKAPTPASAEPEAFNVRFNPGDRVRMILDYGGGRIESFPGTVVEHRGQSGSKLENVLVKWDNDQPRAQGAVRRDDTSTRLERLTEEAEPTLGETIAAAAPEAALPGDPTVQRHDAASFHRVGVATHKEFGPTATAIARRSTGTIHIGPAFEALPADQQRSVLLHEAGHLIGWRRQLKLHGKAKGEAVALSRRMRPKEWGSVDRGEMGLILQGNKVAPYTAETLRRYLASTDELIADAIAAFHLLPDAEQLAPTLAAQLRAKAPEAMPVAPAGEQESARAPRPPRAPRAAPPSAPAVPPPQTTASADLKDEGEGEIRFSLGQSIRGFYSTLGRAVDGLKQNSATPEQWQGLIQNLTKQGVKPDEIAWSGVIPWLQTLKGKVPKDEVRGFLAESEVQLEEVTLENQAAPPELLQRLRDAGVFRALGAAEHIASDLSADAVEWASRGDTKLANDWAKWLSDRRQTAPRYDSYKLAGGANYREVLLTLPPSAFTAAPSPPFLVIDSMGEIRSRHSTLHDAEGATRDDDIVGQALPDGRVVDPFDSTHEIHARGSDGNYQSSHWDEPNVLAHLRLTDRADADGNRVLFVEEIQSDWHREGREKGYGTRRPDTTGWTVTRPTDPAVAGRAEVRDQDSNHLSTEMDLGRSDAEIIAQVADRFTTEGVPNAPFKTQWHELAMKRALRLAAEGGYDKLAWAPGVVHQERYDLSKHIREVQHGNGHLVAFDTTGALVFRQPMALEETASVIGKEAAQRLAATPEGRSGYRTISGLDLKMGGEWATALYDRALPRFMDKHVKQWGQKVGKTRIVESPAPSHRAPEETEAWSVDITPEMHYSVMHRGQPMWQLGTAPRPETSSATGGPGYTVEPLGRDAHGALRGINLDRTPAETRAALLRELTAELRKVVGPGVKLDLHDLLAYRESATGETMAVLGVQLDDLIRLALYEDGDIRAREALSGTTFHEAGHHLYRAGLIPEAHWRALLKQAPAWRERFDIDARYPEHVRDEEAVMHAADAWRRGELQVKGPLLEAAMRRIQALLEAIRNAVRRVLGVEVLPSAEEVFRLMAEGHYAGRVQPGVAANGDARFALFGLINRGTNPVAVPGQVRETVAALENRAFDRLRYFVQDREIYIRRYREGAEKAGFKLDEHETPDLTAELYPGRVGDQLKKIARRYFTPITDTMRQAGVGLDHSGVQVTLPSNGKQVDIGTDLFLTARHAHERNARIAAINPRLPDGGSGMSNADATAILDAVKNAPASKRQAFERVGGLVDRMMRMRLRALRQAGVYSRAEEMRMRRMYRHYVPLRETAESHAADVEPLRAMTGHGFMGRRRRDPRAKGRFTESPSVTAQAFTLAEESVTRSEKNLVGRTLLNFVRKAIDPTAWEVNPRRTRAYIVKLTSAGTVREEVRYRNVEDYDRSDTVSVWVDGREFLIKIKDPRLVESLTAMSGIELNHLLRGMSTITGWLSKANTMYNIEFTVQNAIMDFQTGLLNMTAENRRGLRRQVTGNWKSAWLGAHHFARSGKTDTPWARHAADFHRLGGATAFNELTDTARQEKKLKEHIAELNAATVKGALPWGWDQVKKAFRGIENLNTAFDQALRLSMFIALRDQHGYSERRAAQVAKNITVNFNRKGLYGPWANAIWVFFNASIQGSHSIARAAVRSRKLQGIMAGIVAAGFLMEILNNALARAFGDDDDELGLNAWERVPEHVKQRNWMIMWGGEPGDYATLRMPYGFNLLHNFGRSIAAMGLSRTGLGGRQLNGRPTGIGDMMTTMLEVARQGILPSPFGGSFHGIPVPTVLSPFLEAEANRDAFGRPIAPEPANPRDNRPDSARYYRNIDPVSKTIGTGLNTLTGGDAYEPGWLDVSPESIQHVARQFAGTGLTVYADLLGFGYRAVTEMMGLRAEDPHLGLHHSLSEFPFLRRHVGSESPYQLGQATRERVIEVDRTWSRLKGAAQAGDREAAQRAVAQDRELLALEPSVNSLLNKLSDIASARRGIAASSKPTAEKRVLNDRLDEAERKLQAGWNKAYMRQIERQEAR